MANTVTVGHGSRSLNSSEVKLVTASIAKAIAAREAKNHHRAFCYQPRQCSCDACAVVMQAIEKLRLNQEAVYRLFLALRSIKVWGEHCSFLQFCAPGGFRYSEPRKAYSRRPKLAREWIANAATFPADVLIDEAIHINSSRFLRAVLHQWSGTFTVVRDKILDRMRGRKTPHVGELCRMLAALVHVERERTQQSVSIHVGEIRSRLRKRQHGDLIRIVGRIGPEYIEVDEEFGQLLTMKWLGSGDRMRHSTTVLANRFKQAGKPVMGA